MNRQDTNEHRYKKDPQQYIPVAKPKPGEVQLKVFVLNEAQRLHTKPHTIEVRINRQRKSGIGEYAKLFLRHQTKRTVWARP